MSLNPIAVSFDGIQPAVESADEEISFSEPSKSDVLEAVTSVFTEKIKLKNEINSFGIKPKKIVKPTLTDKNKWSSLRQAVLRGDIDAVKLAVIGKGVDIDAMDVAGRTLLMLAAKQGHKSIVEFLLSKGADSKLVDNVGWNVLHWAAEGGHKDIAELLLESKLVDLETFDKEGKTAFTIAVWKNRYDFVVFLLGKGANYKVFDKTGMTAFHLGAVMGHLEVVRLLLDKTSTDVNIQTTEGGSALIEAASQGQENMVEFLLSRHADPHIVDIEGGMGALHWAVFGGYLEIVKLLSVTKGIDIDLRDRFGRTPLMLAIWKGHKSIVEFLLSKGADSKLVDNVGWNVLHWAAEGGHKDIAELLLDRKLVDLESLDREGKNAFLIAAWKGHCDVVAFLLDRKANHKAVDKSGGSAAHLAVSNGHFDIVQLLLDHKIVDINSQDMLGKTALMLAAKNGHKSIVEFLLSKGADSKIVDKMEWNILHWAVEGGQLDTVRIVLDRRLVDLESIDVEGKTAFIIAAWKGHRDVVAFLLDRKANHKAVDKRGLSAFHSAALMGRQAVLRLLLDEGLFDINSRTTDRKTALIIAAAGQQHSTVKFLLDKGANRFFFDNKGATAYISACESGCIASRSLLKTISMERSYSVEYLWRKLIAHAFEIDGKSHLVNPEGEVLGEITIDLTSMSRRYLWPKTFKYTQLFLNTVHPLSLDVWKPLKDLIKDELVPSTQAQVLIKRYKEQNPVLAETGYTDHSAILILWHNFLILCDRSGGEERPLAIELIDPKRVDEPLIQGFQNLSKKSYVDYKHFCSTNISLLAKDQDQAFVRMVQKHLVLPCQIISNCTWASAEGAVYGLLVLAKLRALMKNSKEILTEDAIKEICSQQKKNFYSWQKFMQIELLKKYKAKGAGGKAYTPYPKDEELIARCEKVVASALREV